ncbi:exodeoxyribonuclease X C-terminal domain-containing protein [Flavobacterium caeni]|uniref:exodeoxyribonuclease X C-terminal domain-containing protein n=1 Tax=Flavobacterium caeni TaxID=490189 RepID=UPI000B8A5641|nr:hypothetical protein [Flavobacterium caeni]
MKLYDWNSEFEFGKFKGETLKSISEHNMNYIHWCLKNVEWFCVKDEIFENITLVKEYKFLEKKFKNSTIQKYELEILEKLKLFYESLLKIHNDKTEQFELQVARETEYEEEYDDSDHYNYDNWLSDAAGTDDPETMRDVYWNLD